jgi:hypothetical protein
MNKFYCNKYIKIQTSGILGNYMKILSIDFTVSELWIRDIKLYKNKKPMCIKRAKGS